MPITLGLNIASLRSQRQLDRSSKELGTVFERLSSGQRINRASDDAAGLAIAESLQADARVFTQGIRNLNDGLSALNIADGALQELSSIVIRLNELAEQSANGTLGTKQREALDEEAQALSDEYFRIVQTTEFNDQQLFTAEYGELRLQAGYGLEGSIANTLGGALGTGDLADPVVQNLGIARNGIAQGDLNGDGNLDIVTSRNANDEIYVQLGNGDGTYGTGVTYAVGDGPRRLKLGDLDGDGVLDIVVTNQTSDNLSILQGNGDGTFTSQGTFDINVNGLGNGPRDIALADINNDGRLDIGVSNEFSRSVSLLENNGNFNFDIAFEGNVGSLLTAIEFVDANNDGFEDVVLSSINGSTIFLSNGSGSYGSYTGSTFNDGVPTLVGLGFLFDVGSGDFDGDGNQDIVTLSSTADTINISFGNGEGTFNPFVVTSYDAEDSPASLSVGDINGDGHLDIITGGNDGTNYSVGVHLNNGDGTFAERSTFSTGIAGTSIADEDLVLGDINNDGVLDVTVGVGTSIISFLSETQSGVQPLLPFDLNSIAGARQALTEFDRKLDQLAEQRGQIGAFMARIETASSTLTVATENFRAAESRIRDADIAAESSQLTRLNILQQAASAVLAQANIQPQLALLLLGRDG